MLFSRSISQTSPGRSSFVCRTAACCRRRCKTEKWCPTISSWVKPCSRSIADFKAISTTWAAKAAKLAAVIAWQGKGPSEFEAILNMACRSISACRSQDAACCRSVLHRTPHCHEHKGEHTHTHTHTCFNVVYRLVSWDSIVRQFSKIIEYFVNGVVGLYCEKFFLRSNLFRRIFIHLYTPFFG